MKLDAERLDEIEERAKAATPISVCGNTSRPVNFDGDTVLALVARCHEADRLEEENSHLRREVELMMDVAEPHWRGAGIKPSAAWAIAEFMDGYNQNQHEREVAEARNARLADAVKMLAESLRMALACEDDHLWKDDALAVLANTLVIEARKGAGE